MVQMSTRETVIEVVNKLFLYTDNADWLRLQKDVFTENVVFDMSSLGGDPPTKKSAREICDLWASGFEGIDSIHHQTGNYSVSFPEEGQAKVFCYATATHYKKAARNGNVRTFVGSYELVLVLTDIGWKIQGFKYNVKYVDGNLRLD
jgi:hypothetical protein